MNLDRLVADAGDLRLQSERLVLRRMTEADMPTAIVHEQDRRIMQWIRDPLPTEEIEARCRAQLNPWNAGDGQWLILAVQPRGQTVNNFQEMIGIVCYRVTTADTETVEIGYRLHHNVHRQGFAAEACRTLIDYLFNTIDVRKLVALCITTNEPSWRLMEKLGMTREATLREYSFLAGAWRDEHVYGLLQREWRK